ncbi:MAG: hypothetical protein ACYC0X_19805 [Pirellulaceae bacterium]
MMTFVERAEMAIPTSYSEFIFSVALGTIAVLATLMAVLNLFFQVAIIVSCIWLAFIIWSIWTASKDDGGFRRWLINILGVFARKQFVESINHNAGSVEIHLGYQLFGCRLFYFQVPLDQIETVEWGPGQGGPRWWQVCIWYDHHDPKKRLERQKWGFRKPDQDVYCVGPSMRKEKTEAFGLTFVDFLCRAGATLVRGTDDCLFVRAASRTTENNRQPTT